METKDAISKLIESKTKMEGEILTSIQSIISDFKEETGLTPVSVDVEMIDTTTFMNAAGLVYKVTCKIDLDRP